MTQPIIGISVDNQDNTALSGKYESSIAYSRCVAAADGLPVLLPHEPQLAGRFLDTCDGLVLTGGADPRTEPFGQPTHPKARPMDTRRQEFELALLSASDQRRDKPVLGICLGMQLMGLRAGAQLHQYLPEILDQPLRHQNNNRHRIIFCAKHTAITSKSFSTQRCTVVSWHQQAVNPASMPGDPNTTWPIGKAGPMRIVAYAPDGVVEAIDDPTRPFYVGVQWHPERGGSGDLNQGLIDRFVRACRRATSPRP